jgi:hypothetical protein
MEGPPKEKGEVKRREGEGKEGKNEPLSGLGERGRLSATPEQGEGVIRKERKERERGKKTNQWRGHHDLNRLG